MKNRNLYFLVALLACASNGYAQVDLSTEAGIYEYIGFGAHGRLDIFSDSTYAYFFDTTMGFNVVDSGSWTKKHDFLILNSRATLSRKPSLRHTRKDKLTLYPLLFKNSCFGYQGDRLIWLRVGEDDWVYKKKLEKDVRYK